MSYFGWGDACGGGGLTVAFESKTEDQIGEHYFKYFWGIIPHPKILNLLMMNFPGFPVSNDMLKLISIL